MKRREEWCKIIIYDGVTIKEDGKILSSLWSISNFLEEVVRLQLIKVTIIRFEQFFCKTLGWR